MDYIAVSIRLLLQFHSNDRFSKNYVRDGGSKRTRHLRRMNASNHLKRAVSSLTRGKMGLGSAVIAKDRSQCLFSVVVDRGGQV